MESGSLILTEGYSCGVTAFLEQKSSPPHVALELLGHLFFAVWRTSTSQCRIPVPHPSAAAPGRTRGKAGAAFPRDN